MRSSGKRCSSSRRKASPGPTCCSTPRSYGVSRQEGAILRIRTAQSRILTALLNHNRLNRLIEYEATAADRSDVYTVGDMISDLHAGVWGELSGADVQIDVYRRNLQRAFLEAVEAELTPPSAPASGQRLDVQRDSWNSDVRPVLKGELRSLDREIALALPRTTDRMTPPSPRGRARRDRPHHGSAVRVSVMPTCSTARSIGRALDDSPLLCRPACRAGPVPLSSARGRSALRPPSPATTFADASA